MLHRTQGTLINALCVAAAALFGYWVYGEVTVKDAKINYSLVVLYAIPTIVFGCLAAYTCDGVLSACKNCGLMWAYKATTEYLGSREGRKTVTREDRVYSGSLTYGLPEKTIVRQESVPVKYDNYAVRYKCKWCGHEYCDDVVVEDPNS